MKQEIINSLTNLSKAFDTDIDNSGHFSLSTNH